VVVLARIIPDEEQALSSAAGIKLLVDLVQDSESDHIRGLAADCVARLAHTRAGEYLPDYYYECTRAGEYLPDYYSECARAGEYLPDYYYECARAGEYLLYYYPKIVTLFVRELAISSKTRLS
jgi:hypothetical protein